MERTRITLALYVDRTRKQWVVRDPSGQFWILPTPSNSWEQRQPFQLTPADKLDPVPGHYKSLLSLPF